MLAALRAAKGETVGKVEKDAGKQSGYTMNNNKDKCSVNDAAKKALETARTCTVVSGKP